MHADMAIVLAAISLPVDAFAVVSLAATWVLVALGLHLTFGLVGIVNLAHGSFLLVGAYVALAVHGAGGTAAAAGLAAVVVTALLGAVMDIGLLRRLQARPLDTLLATFGVGIVLQQAVRLLAGPNPQAVPDPIGRRLEFAGMIVPGWRLLIVLSTVAIVVVLQVLIMRTRTGVRWRAVAGAPELAIAIGIDARRTRTVIVAVGSGLAGLAGALLAPLSSLTPQYGTRFLVPAFLVVLLGRPGSLGGLVVAGVVLGGSLAAAQFVIGPVTAEIAVIGLVVVLLRLIRGVPMRRAGAANVPAQH